MPEFTVSANGEHPSTGADYKTLLDKAVTEVLETIPDTALRAPTPPAQRIKPRPETKYGLVDTLTINFLQRFAADAERFHTILFAHLDGSQPLDANTTRVLLKLLDIIGTACDDIDLHSGKAAPKKTKGPATPPVPAMRS